MTSTSPIIIVDIDSTLSDPSFRLHHLFPNKENGEKKNWGAFFREAKNDPPIPAMVKIYKIFYTLGYDLRVVTGRPEHLRFDTLTWFEQYGMPLKTENLFMRSNSDRRPDFLVKEDALRSWEVPVEKIFCAFEDRLQVVAMWKSFGIPVFVCGNDYEDSSNFLKFREEKERLERKGSSYS